jgi:putative transposase
MSSRYCQVNCRSDNQPVHPAYSTDAYRHSLSSSSFPAEIIGHCVWLYFHSPLSFREVEEILARRGVVLSYETVQMCLSLGQIHANDLRRRWSLPVDHRYLDEVVLKIE